MTETDLAILKDIDLKLEQARRYMMNHDIKVAKFEFNEHEIVLLDRLITMRLLEERL